MRHVGLNGVGQGTANTLPIMTWQTSVLALSSLQVTSSILESDMWDTLGVKFPSQPLSSVTGTHLCGRCDWHGLGAAQGRRILSRSASSAYEVSILGSFFGTGQHPSACCVHSV